MNFSGIIFDMDGVLVDNNEFHYKAFEVFCAKYKIKLIPENYNAYMTGRTNERIMRYLFGEQLTDKEVDDLAYEKEAVFRELYRPFLKPTNGLVELLEIVHSKGVVCAVASNGPFENINFVLDETGIRKYFNVVVNATMVKEGKPAPDIFLKAAELLGKKPNECVVFEDSPTGIKAGVAAHIKVIGVSSTHEEHELVGTEFIVKDFTDNRLNGIFRRQ